MIKEKIKSLANGEGKGEKVDSKKKLENLVVLVIILIITIVAINSIWSKEKVPNNTNTNNISLADKNINEEVNDSITVNSKLDEKLESILSSINGVGKVKVFINYSESSTLEAMYNETKKESSTEETDTSGGVRTIQQTDTQKDIIYSENSGNKAPVTQKVINPVIEGAIITAQGAGDSNIKANIIDAVSAVTGLATHKIQVFKMNN